MKIGNEKNKVNKQKICGIVFYTLWQQQQPVVGRLYCAISPGWRFALPIGGWTDRGTNFPVHRTWLSSFPLPSPRSLLHGSVTTPLAHTCKPPPDPHSWPRLDRPVSRRASWESTPTLCSYNAWRPQRYHSMDSSTGIFLLFDRRCATSCSEHDIGDLPSPAVILHESADWSLRIKTWTNPMDLTIVYAAIQRYSKRPARSNGSI